MLLPLQKSESKKFSLIIEKIKENPHDGVKLLYDEYGRLIKLTAKSVCKSESDADEVVNDILVKIWSIAHEIRNVANPRGWIYVITVNCARDKLRRKRDVQFLAEILPESDSFVNRIYEEYAFYQIIDCLKGQEKEVIINKVLCKFTFKEIAEMSHIPISSVSSLFYRGLEKLRLKLQNC